MKFGSEDWHFVRIVPSARDSLLLRHQPTIFAAFLEYKPSSPVLIPMHNLLFGKLLLDSLCKLCACSPTAGGPCDYAEHFSTGVNMKTIQVDFPLETNRGI